MRAGRMWKSDCRWWEENPSTRMTIRVRASLFSLLGLAMFAEVWQSEGMKKQAADQSFHDRRYQERKRAEAARKAPKKKVVEAK